MIDHDASEKQSLLYARDIAQLHQLRRAYEKLLPRGLSSATAPAPVIRTVTALFTDLNGFTRLTEQFEHDPAGLLDVLNAHLKVVVRAITICGGVVEKFVGDGVMATFGAEGGQPDHVERSMAAAIGLIGANEALNRRRSSNWGFRLEVGVGIATGPVVVGSIGPRERSELGVLGDCVNVAARLVAHAEGGEILMTGAVHSALADKLSSRLTDRSAVRGRTGSLSIYRMALLGGRGALE